MSFRLVRFPVYRFQSICGRSGERSHSRRTDLRRSRRGLDLRLRHLLPAALLVLSLPSCRHRSAPIESNPADADHGSSVTNNDIDWTRAYPRARWRLAPSKSLLNVELWVSHILIRHDHSNREAPFDHLIWDAEPPAPARSRAAALDLAVTVAKRAMASPEKFPDLVREYSEDVVTKESAGSLGGISAAAFWGDPPVLDALAAIRPGEVSRVVETSQGFHIFYRRPPPDPVTIAARRFLIPYAGTHSTFPSSDRSRDDALAVARALSAALRADPQRQSATVRGLSTAGKMFDEGEIGNWSNRETSDFPRELEQLASLPEGGVTEPLDSLHGFHVFLRTKVDVQPAFSVNVLKFSFDPSGDNPSESREHVFARAQSIADDLQQSPEQFAQFQSHYCCRDPELWRFGRTPDTLFQAAANLRVGETLRTPIENGSQLVIARRIGSSQNPVVAPTIFEIPAPSVPDVATLAPTASGPTVQTLIRDIGHETAPSLHLSAQQTQAFLSLHDQLAKAFDRTGSQEGREAALISFDKQIRALIDSTQHETYMQLSNDRVAAALMATR